MFEGYWGNRTHGTGGEQGFRVACDEPANDWAHEGALAGQDGRFLTTHYQCVTLWRRPKAEAIAAVTREPGNPSTSPFRLMNIAFATMQ